MTSSEYRMKFDLRRISLLKILVLLLVCCLLGSMPCCAAPAENANEKAGSEGFVINFNNINIIEYIRFISQISNKNFIFNEAELDFRVTIVSEEPTSIDNIMTALLQILRIHGLSMIEEGNNILIHKNKEVTPFARLVADDKEQELARKEDAEIMTQLFHVENVKVGTVATVLQPMIAPPASMSTLPETGHIIITDFASNLSKIGQLIKSIDTPTQEFDIGQYTPREIGLTTLIELADKILTPMAQETTFLLIPHEATGSIFIASTPHLVTKAVAILKILDTSRPATTIFRKPSTLVSEIEGEGMPARPEVAEPKGVEMAPVEEEVPTVPEITPRELEGLIPRRLEAEAWERFGLPREGRPGEGPVPTDYYADTEFSVYKLIHRKGDQIQTALSELATSLAATGPANQDLALTIDGVQWIESSNSLIFSGTPKSIHRVRKFIEELDSPARQVFIEMLIITTTVDNSLSFGVEHGYRAQSPDISTAFGFIPSSGTSQLPAALNSVSIANAPNTNSLMSQPGFSLGVIGKILTHGGLGYATLGALMSSLNTDSETEVIMNPKIIVEDNVAAEIFVGQNTRYRGQSITNDEGSVITTNFEYRDVGSTLKVIPHLGLNDVIALEIEQELSAPEIEDATDEAISAEVGPVTLETRTTTRVHVPNNYFVIMSGMIQNQRVKTKERVPCLGGLPLIGAAFGNKSDVITKRNLMIFLRPTIVDTADEIEELTKRQQDIYRDSNDRPDSFKFEVDAGLDFLNLRRRVK